LLLRDEIHRATEDLDVLALVGPFGYESAEPLPASLIEAIDDVRQLHPVDERWLNSGPTHLLRFALPDGFATRTDTLAFGGLTLRVASRFDLVCLKLLAAIGDVPKSKHRKDLLAMRATRTELENALSWVVGQDSAPEFPVVARALVEWLLEQHGGA
jgi:hypothetical protein